MTPTNRHQNAHTYFGYPQLQWAEQHQATMRRIAAEEHLARQVRPAQPGLVVRVATLLTTARGWAAAIAAGVKQPKAVP
jgi:hypothetical protein